MKPSNLKLFAGLQRAEKVWKRIRSRVKKEENKRMMIKERGGERDRETKTQREKSSGRENGGRD